MKIKVCGMKYPENISDLVQLQPDYIGFIFYEKSPRFAADLDSEVLSLPTGIKKTGVFVNEAPDKIKEFVREYQLQALQLHGNESPEFCSSLRESGCEIIKAFGICTSSDLNQTDKYETGCDYFLFDTGTSNYGGSGKQYDWNILKNYKGKIPFFLSGGIGVNDAERILQFRHPLLYGVDLNSCFETKPAFKDISLLKQFTDCLRIGNNM